jgi:hypothetical protein
MWGVSCTQGFMYFSNYCSGDSKKLKYWVAIIIILDTANEILCFSSQWKVLILQYGRIAGLLEIQPELAHHLWLTALITVSIQMYLLYRIYVFSGRRRFWLYFGFTVGTASSWQIIEAISYDILAFANYTLPALSTPRMVNLGISVRACSAVTDIAIGAAMGYLLTRNGPSPFQRTRRMIYRLLMLTVLTGLWTSIFSLLVLILVAKLPDGLWYCIFEFPLSSLYLSTLLANLNARRFVRGEAGISDGSEIGGISYNINERSNATEQSLALSPTNRNRRYEIKLANSKASKDTDITIQVDTSTEVDQSHQDKRQVGHLKSGESV